MSQEISLAPSEIRFMQDTIQPHFYDGLIGVNDTINDICHGRKDLTQIPIIEVTKRNNKYYSLDNRRLYLFRVLQKRGYLSHINVRLVSRWDKSKFTTRDDGASVRMRKEHETYPHSFDELFVNLAEICRPEDENERTPSVPGQSREEFVEQSSRSTLYDRQEKRSCCKRMCTIM